MTTKNKATKTQRELAKEELQRFFLKGPGFLLIAGLRAVTATVSGSIGYEVTRSTGEVASLPPTQTYTNTLASQAIGAAILSPFSTLFLAACTYILMKTSELSGKSRYDILALACTSILLTPVNGQLSVFEADIGAAILGLDPIHQDRENSFTALPNLYGGLFTGLLISATLVFIRLAYLANVVLNSTPQRSLQHSQPLMLTQFSSARAGSSADSSASIQNLKAEVLDVRTAERASYNQSLSLN